MKNFAMLLICSLFCIESIYAAGSTSEGSLLAINVSGEETLITTNNNNNPDGCSNRQVLLLESFHPANKQIHSLATVALTTGMPATFYVDGCAIGQGQDTYPIIKSIKVEAQ